MDQSAIVQLMLNASDAQRANALRSVIGALDGIARSFAPSVNEDTLDGVMAGATVLTAQVALDVLISRLAEDFEATP